MIVIFLKIVVLLIFFFGISDSLRKASGKIMIFVKKLGIVGGAYLASYPLTVLIVETIVPSEQHRNIITFVE